MSLKGALINKQDTDTWIFGNSPLTSIQKVLQSDGQWLDRLPVAELQRDKDWSKSNYGCVAYSRNNGVETLFKRLYNFEINIDDRDLVVGSGTIPYKGNYLIAVAEWQRKNGFILERTQGLYNTLEVSEYYKWERDEEADKEAKNSLDLFEIGYEFLVRPNWSADVPQEQIKEALKYAPLQVVVDGKYEYDSNGYVHKNLYIYSHAVVIVGWEKNSDGSVKHWWVFDSSHEGLMKFHPDYRFGYPLINTLIKKNSMKLFRKKGEQAIYFLNPADNKLVAFADGIITGGEMFKILFGDYKYAPTVVVDELPHPIADYSMITK